MVGEGMSECCASDEVEHYISKVLTQRLERTNGTLRQQTGRWHRRQNKFSKIWEQTEIALRLIINYFNWMQAAFVPGNGGGTASRVDRTSLDLE